MTYFQGSEEYTVDAKGRISIPPSMRRSLSPEARETFTLTRGVRKFIAAYPIDEWSKVQENIRKKNPFVPENDKVITFLNMFCKEVTLDAQNRIIIPKNLLQYANIDSKVFIIGKVDHIEFWNPEEFNKVYVFDEEEYAQLFAKVLGYDNKFAIENITEEQTKQLG